MHIFVRAHPCSLDVNFWIIQFWGTFWIGLDQPLFTFPEALRRDPAHLSDCLPMHPNSLRPHSITIYTNTNTQIHKCKKTNTQIQTHKYTNTRLQTQKTQIKDEIQHLWPTSTQTALHPPHCGRPRNITCIVNNFSSGLYYKIQPEV